MLVKVRLTDTINPICLVINYRFSSSLSGGTSAIFICDDGMQVLPPADQQERKAFYANHNIGWTARPGHSSKPEGFKRAGKFKKASNMNYALNISLKLEKFLVQLLQDGAEDNVDECLEDRALKMALDEVFEESERKFVPWGANGKSLRMGEIILIVDCDTIVPEVRPGMHPSPHRNTILKVTHKMTFSGNRIASETAHEKWANPQKSPSSNTNPVCKSTRTYPITIFYSF
jgi:hypothetical protein